MLLGIILCQNTPWYWAGGLFDFRFDFIAYCLYGIWVCAVVQSRVFLDRCWAIACGLIGAILVLNRFLTLVYLLGVSGGFAVFCVAVVFLRRRDSDLTQRMSRRLHNLVLSVGVLVIIVTPFLIRSWREIFEYYGVGHILSDVKAVRAHQTGLNSLADHLLFYPNSILRDQWGLNFILGVAIVLIGSLIVGLVNSRKAPKKSFSGRDETFGLQIIFLLGAILGPMIVLMMDTDKSPVVCGIIGVPAALLVVTLSARVAAVHCLEVSVNSKTIIACSMSVFALGFVTVFDRLSRHLPEYTERDDLMRLVGLNKWMVDYASEHGWRDPGISVDVISPWFNGYGVTDTGYEETGKFIEFHLMLGHDVMGTDREEALSQLAHSDFFILTTANSPETALEPDKTSLNASSGGNYHSLSVLGRLNPFIERAAQEIPNGISLEASTAAIQRFPMLRHHLFPFYEHRAHYWNDLKAWADKNMILAQNVQFEKFTATVYVHATGVTSNHSVEAH
jgi:hypothetical protein